MVSVRVSIRVYVDFILQKYYTVLSILRIHIYIPHSAIPQYTHTRWWIYLQKFKRKLSLDNTKYHSSGKYSLTDIYGVCDFPHFFNLAALQHHTRCASTPFDVACWCCGPQHQQATSKGVEAHLVWCWSAAKLKKWGKSQTPPATPTTCGRCRGGMLNYAGEAGDG